MAWLIAGVMWLLVLVNLFRLRAPRGDRGLLGAAFWAAIALTFNIDAIHSKFDELVHVPNLSSLIEHACDVLAVTFIASIFTAVAGPAPGRRDPSRRRSSAVAAAAVVVLTVLFVSAPTHHESLHFAADYGSRPPLTAFWAITMGYLIWVAIGLLTLTVTQYHRIHRRAIRGSFVLVAVGSVALIPFGVAKVLVAIGGGTSSWWQRGANAMSPPLLALATFCYALGLALPALTASTTQLWRRIEDYTLLQALGPMWRSLLAAVPQAALDKPTSTWSDVLPGQSHLRLSSRVVEIRDAQLVLAGYVTPSERVTTTGQASDAVMTSAALQRRADQIGTAPGTPREFAEGRDTITDEAKYLVEVWQQMSASAATAGSRWVQVISNVFAPQVVASLVSFTAGLASGRGLLADLAWGSAAVLVAPITPALTFKLIRDTKVAVVQYETVNRGQVIPLAAAAASCLLGIGVLWTAGAPRLTLVTACAMATGLICLMVSRTSTNVSAHVSITAGALAFAALVFSPWCLLASFILAMVARSRLAVGAHTLPQVVWAAPLGVVACSVPLIIAGYRGF